MTEYELISLFNSFLVSNAIYFVGNVILLWVKMHLELLLLVVLMLQLVNLQWVEQTLLENVILQ